VNAVFFAIIAISWVTAAITGNMEAVSTAAFAQAQGSVSLVINLIGYMALFLGVLQVAQDAGLLRMLARSIRPLMIRLFPDVPADHPAMGAMIMNISANMLGLGNAATPFGIKAMGELEKLNRNPGTATNAMVLFLAINTSGIALLPSGAVSVRAAEGSLDPWNIVAPTLFATGISTIVGITVAKWLAGHRKFALPAPEREITSDQVAGKSEVVQGKSMFGIILLTLLSILVLPPVISAFLPAGDSRDALQAFANTAGDWVIPTIIFSMIAFGFSKGVKVYESFVEGAKEGWDTGVRIIPYVLAILVAVGMFRASGAMDFMTGIVGIITDPVGLPADLVPQALVRPLSGSGAGALMMENIQTHGADSYTGTLSSVMNGSTETTFYVLAVYFGSVGVSKIRHAVFAGLAADFAGLVASVVICMALFGHLR